MTQNECAEQWNILKLIIVKRIKDINDATPAEGDLFEPRWWLEMMQIYRLLTLPQKDE